MVLEIVIKALLAVVLGGLIGSERARHGRAAGMRTHILVCLGATLTSMIGIYVSTAFGVGDVLRIPAQVVSGIGFLGAGMIVLKNNNMITGLTTAAGVWTTSIIGIAIGYGFYWGAIIIATVFLIAIILFSRFGRKRKSAEVIYIEIDNLYKTNDIIESVMGKIGNDCTIKTIEPKSMKPGNLGILIMAEQKLNFNVQEFKEIENIVFASEEY